VTQQIIVIINENNTDPITVVAHITHYTQNLCHMMTARLLAQAYLPTNISCFVHLCGRLVEVMPHL